MTALTRSLDASSHKEQAESIRQITKLGELLHSYPNIQVRLQWLPKKVPFIGFQRARKLTFEAIHITDTTTINEPKSIKKQKEVTKHTAITAWKNHYYNDP